MTTFPKPPAELRRLVEQEARALYLEEWSLLSQWDEQEAPAGLGSVSFYSGRGALLTVSRTAGPEVPRREIVRHELLHVVLRPLSKVAEQWKMQIPEEQQDLYAKQLGDAEEVVIAHLLRLLRAWKPGKGG